MNWVLAFLDLLPGLEELGKPGHCLLLPRHAAREDIPVLNLWRLIHHCQQCLASQGVREGFWLTAACQETLLTGKQVPKVAPDASCCPSPQGQQEWRLFPGETSNAGFANCWSIKYCKFQSWSLWLRWAFERLNFLANNCFSPCSEVHKNKEVGFYLSG